MTTLVNATTTTSTHYYHFNGQRIAMRQNGVLTYLHGDHLGSASLATTAAGAQVSVQRYLPYGGTRDGAMPTDRQFTGQRNESALGFYDYNARQYDPVLGRFLQADTIVPQPGNPQSLNRYAYTLNNPLRYTDPSGHAYCPPEANGRCIDDVPAPRIISTPTIIPGSSDSTPSAGGSPKPQYASLQPHIYTGAPAGVDFLLQPILNIIPRVQFYSPKSLLRVSLMYGDIELEWGIKEQARTESASPLLFTADAMRVYAPSGALWFEGGSGSLGMGIRSSATTLRAKDLPLQVQSQIWSVGGVRFAERPGVIQSALGVEYPVVASFGPLSVRQTFYARAATNVYGDRMAAGVLWVGVGVVVWKAWPLLAGGGAVWGMQRFGEALGTP